jgi:hypothetical protein
LAPLANFNCRGAVARTVSLTDDGFGPLKRKRRDFKMHFFADQAVVRVISRRDKGTRPSRARSLELEQLQFFSSMVSLPR